MKLKPIYCKLNYSGRINTNTMSVKELRRHMHNEYIKDKEEILRLRAEIYFKDNNNGCTKEELTSILNNI